MSAGRNIKDNYMDATGLKYKKICLYFSKKTGCASSCTHCPHLHVCTYCWGDHSASVCPFEQQIKLSGKSMMVLFNVCVLCDRSFAGHNEMATHMCGAFHAQKREAEFNLLKTKNPDLTWPVTDPNVTRRFPGLSESEAMKEATTVNLKMLFKCNNKDYAAAAAAMSAHTPAAAHLSGSRKPIGLHYFRSDEHVSGEDVAAAAAALPAHASVPAPILAQTKVQKKIQKSVYRYEIPADIDPQTLFMIESLMRKVGARKTYVTSAELGEGHQLAKQDQNYQINEQVEGQPDCGIEGLENQPGAPRP